jgi:hypothetical protein
LTSVLIEAKAAKLNEKLPGFFDLFVCGWDPKFQRPARTTGSIYQPEVPFRILFWTQPHGTFTARLPKGYRTGDEVFLKCEAALRGWIPTKDRK